MEPYSGRVELKGLLEACLKNIDYPEGLCPLCKYSCKKETKIVFCKKYEPEED